MFYYKFKKIALSDTENNIFVYNLQNCSRIKSIKIDNFEISHLKFNNKGNKLAIFSSNKMFLKVIKLSNVGFLLNFMRRTSVEEKSFNIKAQNKEYQNDEISLEWDENDKNIILKIKGKLNIFKYK